MSTDKNTLMAVSVLLWPNYDHFICEKLIIITPRLLASPRMSAWFTGMENILHHILTSNLAWVNLGHMKMSEQEKLDKILQNHSTFLCISIFKLLVICKIPISQKYQNTTCILFISYLFRKT